MRQAIKWLPRVFESIAALMLATIFVTFLLQIGSRYLHKVVDGLGLSQAMPRLAAVEPLGWTLELIGILWVWVIFFACAFVLRERDHVRFDILYLATPRKVQRIFALISALAIVAGMVYAFLPTWDYIDFMRLRKTATVHSPFSGDKIPLRTIFSIYAIFMITVALRYAWLAIRVLRHGPPKTELEIVLNRQSREETP